MSMIDRAVKDGIAEGFRVEAFSSCSGAEDPEERCPMDLSKGHCVCAYMHWENLPWYRKVFAEKPPTPSNDDSLGCILNAAFEEYFDRKEPRHD